jgi:rhamnulokinase
MARKAYLGVDLGAESGRVIVGLMSGDRLKMHTAHRFPHQPAALPAGLHWNTAGIWQQVLDGLRAACQWCRENNAEPASVGVDTWGVDYALIGQSGQVLGWPRTYRDPQHREAFEQVRQQLGDQRLYDATGIQLMPINTLYQLALQRQQEPGLLELAQTLIFMPDLLHYFLTGQLAVEASDASTSQMIDARTGQWATDLLGELSLPTHMLQPTVPAGTSLGPLRAPIAEAAGASSDLPVIVPAGHDTASAVAAVPASGDQPWAYLSSGTWSLMGAELAKPMVTPAAREAAFTNEAGVGGTVRFLKNIAGLWLVQETRRDYAERGQDVGYDQLTGFAQEAEPFRTLVNPDHPPFLHPGHMPEKIATFARATNQPVPETLGQFVRCCLESLALKYRQTLDQLEDVLDQRFAVLHIVGGGGKNTLLNQMTANALQRPAVVGPYEATAAGNILVQAMGAGDLAGPTEVRQTVARSVSPDTYEPAEHDRWQQAYERFQQVCQLPVPTSE